jgi:hypothetical protein
VYACFKMSDPLQRTTVENLGLPFFSRTLKRNTVCEVVMFVLLYFNDL